MEGIEFRGKQSNILRLIAFDKMSFIHMAFYRVLAFLALFTSIFIIISILYNNITMIKISEYLVVLIAVFFTPQLYSIMKVFSIEITKGASSGYMNESFLVSSGIKKNYFMFLSILQYFVVIIWIFFIIIFIFELV